MIIDHIPTLQIRQLSQLIKITSPYSRLLLHLSFFRHPGSPLLNLRHAAAGIFVVLEKVVRGHPAGNTSTQQAWLGHGRYLHLSAFWNWLAMKVAEEGKSMKFVTLMPSFPRVGSCSALDRVAKTVRLVSIPGSSCTNSMILSVQTLYTIRFRRGSKILGSPCS